MVHRKSFHKMVVVVNSQVVHNCWNNVVVVVDRFVAAHNPGVGNPEVDSFAERVDSSVVVLDSSVVVAGSFVVQPVGTPAVGWVVDGNCTVRLMNILV